MDYCYHCMAELNGPQTCPVCGRKNTDVSIQPYQLPPGTVLAERYLLGRVLGKGAFGITYIGLDLRLNIRIAVKEYYPSVCSTRSSTVSPWVSMNTAMPYYAVEGKAKFLQEARVLALFRDTDGIVNVYDYFEANGTAYIVMQYLEGQTLKEVLKYRTFEPDEIFGLMLPVMDALDAVHQQDLIHRDISPDNLMLTPDHRLVLMDFGAAREFSLVDPLSMTIMVKHGYAPEEQYRLRGETGPWTDVYALCATIYHCLTGILPQDANDRAIQDEVLPPSAFGVKLTRAQESALKHGMAITAKKRIQTMHDLKAALKLKSNSLPEDAGWTVPQQPLLVTQTIAIENNPQIQKLWAPEIAAQQASGMTGTQESTAQQVTITDPNPYAQEQQNRQEIPAWQAQQPASEVSASASYTPPAPAQTQPSSSRKKKLTIAISAVAALALCIAVGLTAWALRRNGSSGTSAQIIMAAESSPVTTVNISSTPVAAANDTSFDGEAAVFWYTFNDTYLSRIRADMDAAFDAAGITYRDYDANGSQTSQTDAVTSAIARGASMLIVNLVDASSADDAQTIADKANAAGIPVVFFNRSIAVDDEGAEAIINSITAGSAYVGTDYTSAGMMQGNMIGDYLVENYDAVDLNGDGKISYIMFKGDEANMEAIARTKFAQENADAKLEAAGKPDLEFYDASNTNKYLVDQNGAWSAQAATDYMQTALSQYSEANNNMIELVIANNDEMACGAISALQNAGYNTGDEGSTTIPVFGVDATDAAKEYIAQGVMTGTIRQDAESMADTIVTIAQNLAAGRNKFDSIDSANLVGTWRVNIPYEVYTGSN